MWVGCWGQGMHLERIQDASLLAYNCLRKRRHIVKSKKRSDNEESVSSEGERRSHREGCCKHSSESESESSFEKVVETGVPCNECVEERVRWVRSQIIGYGAEFDSPFGRRIVLYADHTASARSLRYNENFIANHLLPFYGNFLPLSPQIIFTLFFILFEIRFQLHHHVFVSSQFSFHFKILKSI